MLLIIEDPDDPGESEISPDDGQFKEAATHLAELLFSNEQPPSLLEEGDEPVKREVIDPLEESLDAAVGAAEDRDLELLARDIKRVRIKQEKDLIREQEAGAIRSTLTEFFDSFVVLAYDTRGQRFFLQHSPLPTHVDALQKYMEQVSSAGLLYHNKSTPDPTHSEADDIHSDDDADFS